VKGKLTASFRRVTTSTWYPVSFLRVVRRRLRSERVTRLEDASVVEEVGF